MSTYKFLTAHVTEKYWFSISMVFLKPRLRKITAISLVVLLLVSGFLVWMFVSPKDTEAAWYNDNWAYRKRVPVTNNTSSENNVYINFTGADAIDTSDTAKFQADCGDLRFVKENGELLPYYIVSGCGTSTTVVHVNFDTFPAGDMNVYYYYGNPNASDGFEGTDFSPEATNYTIGTQATEEKGPGAALHFKFDEGADNTLHIGERFNSSNPLWGQIDDVRIYNYLLTQQQIKGVISEGALRFGPSTGSP